MTGPWVFVLVLVFAASSSGALRDAPQRCEGRFLVRGRPVRADPAGAHFDALQMQGGTLVGTANRDGSPSSVNVAYSIVWGRFGFRAALYTESSGYFPQRKPRLIAQVSRQCGRIDGRVVREGGVRRFRAFRSRCGDGIADPVNGEFCEDSSACGGNPCVACVCHGPGGMIDSAFGSGGVVRIAGPRATDPQTALLVQPDGKLLAGAASAADGPYLVMRYGTDGRLDQAFGTGGTIVAAPALAVLDGGILAAGPFDASPSLARFTLDGLPDAGFGTGGRIPLPAGSPVLVTQVSSATIVVVGDGYLARFTGGGLPDAAFGTAGVVTTTDPATRLAVRQSDDGVIVAGVAVFSSPPGTSAIEQVALRRFTMDGSADSAFAAAIPTDTFPDNGGGLHALVLQPDGRILVAVAQLRLMSRGSSAARVLARFDASGAPDPFVGPTASYPGWIVLGISTGRTLLAVQPDGRILVAWRDELQRLLPDGSPDLDFGDLGTVVIDQYVAGFTAEAITIQSDGRIVVAGTAGNGEGALLRFRP